MEFCLKDFCLSGQELTILLLLEVLFWVGLGYLGFKKIKKRKQKISKK